MSLPEPRELFPRVCELETCSETDKDLLKRCSSCKVVYCCGVSHQTADRSHHKHDCTTIENARKALKKEEQELCDHMGVGDTPDLFGNRVRYLGAIYQTRVYMRARYNMFDNLLQVYGAPGGKTEAVQEALDHLLDTLRLCRSDNIGAEDLVPHLYIRLNKDQEAYDFVKWFGTASSDPKYDWGDMDLPYLDIRDADVLEEQSENWSTGILVGLGHPVAATLIKVRALLDLQSAQNTTRAFNGTFKPEIRPRRKDLKRARLKGRRMPA